MFRRKTKRTSPAKARGCTKAKRSTTKRKTTASSKPKKTTARTKKAPAKKRTVGASGIKKVIRTIKSNIAALEKKVG